LDKSYRLLSGHQEGLVLRSILTWAASYLSQTITSDCYLYNAATHASFFFGWQRALVF